MSPTPFPQLQGHARPVSHERSERIVSTTVIHHDLPTTWAALTDSVTLSHWLGVADSAWATPGAEAVLDFEDGEFFWCHFDEVGAPSEGTAQLRYRWRWVGIGPASEVVWELAALEHSTSVTVTETLADGPSDWRSWNGMGWPGILDQLDLFLTSGRRTRWPWRRMGPYVQAVMPAPSFQVWSTLCDQSALQFWLGRSSGGLATGDSVTFTLGDASGVATLTIDQHVEPNQQFPSYQPSLRFTVHRPSFPSPLSGYLWVEPAGLYTSILQIFMNGWEGFGQLDQAPVDRHIFTQFWIGAFGRLASLLTPPGSPTEPDKGLPGPHAWSR